MPELKFAELIEGVVHLSSPVSLAHGDWDSLFGGLCVQYCLHTPGVKASANATWLMGHSSAPQPDCSVRILPSFGGRSGLRNNLATGAPELAAEVCHSSNSYDLGRKMALYQAAGVSEYVALLVEERRFEWRVLVDGSYQLMKDEAGVYRSRALPGLWIDAAAIRSEDSVALLRAFELGLASPEHQEFLTRLREARGE
jgi:Uma2 family endonuclease